MFQFSFLPCLLILLNFLTISSNSEPDKSEKILISGYASIPAPTHGHPGQIPDLNLPCIVKSSPTGSSEEKKKSPKMERAGPSTISIESVRPRESPKPLKRKANSPLRSGGYRTATTSSAFQPSGSTSNPYPAPSQANNFPSLRSSSNSYWGALGANNFNMARNNDHIKYTNPCSGLLDNRPSFPSFGSTSDSWAHNASWATTSTIERHNNQMKYTKPYLNQMERQSSYPSFGSSSNSYWARNASMANSSNLNQMERQCSNPSLGSSSNSYWARNASTANSSNIERHGNQIKYTKTYANQLEKEHSFPAYNLSNSYWTQNASRANNSKVERPNLDQLEKQRPILSFSSTSHSEDDERSSKRSGIDEISGHQELDLTLRL